MAMPREADLRLYSSVVHTSWLVFESSAHPVHHMHANAAVSLSISWE